MSHIETIIVSSDYADILAITLPSVVKHSCGDVTVYTKPTDVATFVVAARCGARCVATNAFTKDGAPFNRGAVYNEAFSQLDHREWVLLLDSDIVLPPDCGLRFLGSDPDPECFYGARRYDVQTPKQYAEVQADLAQGVLPRARLFRGFGYGYLQLFHAQSSTFRRIGGVYPEGRSCSEIDWQFRNHWGQEVWDPPFSERGHDEPDVRDHGSGLLRCLPMHVLHLGITGVNSTSRSTPLWAASASST